MIVDENKQYSAFKTEKSRKTYSANNATLLKPNLITAIEKQKKNRTITKCGYKKYRNKLTQKQISGILKKDTIQVSYGKMVRENTKYQQESRVNFQANSRKGNYAIKKTEEKTEGLISKHRKII